MTVNEHELSFWHSTLTSARAPRPALERDTECDVAVVGAGYTGLWTAYYLKKHDPSLRVLLLEAETAGYGASGRNGGWCSSYLSGIDGWLRDPAHRAGAIHLQKLMFDAVHEIGHVVEQASIDCHFELSGALEIAVNPAQLARLRAELEALRALGFGSDDYRWIGPDEMPSTLRVEGALGAVWLRHCAAIHPARLVRGLADTVERMGVLLYEQTPVREFQPRRLRTAAAQVRADRVVLATEGYGEGLGGHRRDLVPVHSMMVVTEALSPRQIDELVIHKRYCFGNRDRIVTYGQRTADGRIAFGCRGSYRYGSQVHRRFDATDPEFSIVRDTLLRFFPSLADIGFTHGWGGAMGVSRSLRPSVSFDAAMGLGRAGGYFGNGVGASQLAGRTLADLLLERDTDRVHTPWVTNSVWSRRWEPEPLRWLAFQSARALMQAADRAEYRQSRLAGLYQKMLKTLFP
ncbi:MAG: FAD-dependent oxidoreductase [Xanthomonadales bacterium]|nr:FAD-dependent oxidoreductase [Xanthomonadales bacterium]